MTLKISNTHITCSWVKNGFGVSTNCDRYTGFTNVTTGIPPQRLNDFLLYKFNLKNRKELVLFCFNWGTTLYLYIFFKTNKNLYALRKNAININVIFMEGKMPKERLCNTQSQDWNMLFYVLLWATQTLPTNSKKFNYCKGVISKPEEHRSIKMHANQNFKKYIHILKPLICR